jgi:hypothetical protein
MTSCNNPLQYFILEMKIMNNWKTQQCQRSMTALQQYCEINVLTELPPIMCHLFPKTIFSIKV